MKTLKRMAVALLATALLVFVMPAAAFASGASSDPTGGTPTAAPTAEPTATPAPTAEPTATPAPTAEPTTAPTTAPSGTAVTFKVDGKAYQVAMGGSPVTSLSQYDTGIAITLTYSASGAFAASDYVVKVESCDFTSLNGNVYAFASSATSGTITLDSLKLSGAGRSLKVGFYPAAGGKAVSTAALSIGEVAVVSAPTEPTAPDPIPTMAPDPQTASLIIRSASIGQQSVNAGEEFSLSLTIYATTSGNRNAEDVVVSVTPGEGITLASGSSSTYIGAMAPGATKTVSFPMKALDSFTGGVGSVTVSVVGSGAGSSTTIAVPVIQADRFEISGVQCPESLTAGEEDVLSVIFVNKGKNSINNLTVSFNGENVATPVQSEYVGNLPAGTQNSVDFDIQGLEEGPMTGVITVTYEGNDGQAVTLTQEVSCNIEAPFYWGGGEDYYDPGFAEDPGMMVDVDSGNRLPGWAIPAIAAAALVAVIVVVAVVRKKRKAKLALEAENEDI